MSDNPLRVNFNRQWNNFTPEIQRYEVDMWLFNNTPELGRAVDSVMTDFPDSFLWFEILSFHGRSQRNELSDEWLARSALGRILRTINVRILAVVERTILGEIEGEHVRCSLLLGPI